MTADPGAGVAPGTGAGDSTDGPGRRSRPDTVLLLLGGILAAAVASAVLLWFVLGMATQVRDQETLANGLQHCIIRAQLSQVGVSQPDSAAYKAAVQSCLGR